MTTTATTETAAGRNRQARDTDLTHREHYVYEIHSAATGDCIYVGMTCDLNRRLREHARLRMWRTPAFHIVAHRVSDRPSAVELEAHLIRTLRPNQNRHGTGRAA